MIALKWWTIFVAIVAGLIAAWFLGYVDYVLANDVTRLSVAILALFMGASCWTGVLAARKPSENQVMPNFLWFASDACMSLGMMGTTVGLLIVLTSNFNSVDASNVAAMSSLMAVIASGMGTALTTTFVGLGASLLLKFQLVVIEG